MAAHGGDDEAVQHADQVDVLLEVARDVLRHALRDVEAFNVDHDFFDHFLLVFF